MSPGFRLPAGMTRIEDFVINNASFASLDYVKLKPHIDKQKEFFMSAFATTFHENTSMSSSLVFDTHACVKKLKAAGISEQQAEAQVEMVAEIIQEKLATKQDLKKVETGLRHEIREMGYKLTIRMGGMLVAAVTVLAILIKIL